MLDRSRCRRTPTHCRTGPASSRRAASSSSPATTRCSSRASPTGRSRLTRTASQFPDWDAIARDLDLITELGANCLRTFTVPPRWVLDLAASRGVRVLVGIPWAEHICFLDSKKVTDATSGDRWRTRWRPARAIRRSSAYWSATRSRPTSSAGTAPTRIAGFLRELVGMVKEIEPGTLVSYANFPSTEYLETEFTDFLAFNVYLHREADFRRYLSRLHDLAGDRPLVLTEFGIDSIREGEETQAATLSWQVRAAFEMGVAGTCVFSWTDEWFTGGRDVADWAFGLVDRERRREARLPRREALVRGDGLPAPAEYPKVSVVICAYNAEPTMEACLESLRDAPLPRLRGHRRQRRLDGPHRRDRRALRGLSRHPPGEQGAERGAQRRHGGVARARSSPTPTPTAWSIPTGCTIWSRRSSPTGLRAVGGPNLPPPEDSFVAACVAASPGGPPHVLLDDEVAEHIPGCNMAFRREALEEIGGFEPDLPRRRGRRRRLLAPAEPRLPHRLQPRGDGVALPAQHGEGVPQAAARLRQGGGAALLQASVPLQHARPIALARAHLRRRLRRSCRCARPVIYCGAFGRGLFQTLYEPPSSLLAYLPFTLEWNAGRRLGLLVYAVAHGGCAWLGRARRSRSTWAACLGRGAARAGRPARRRRPRPRCSSRS